MSNVNRAVWAVAGMVVLGMCVCLTSGCSDAGSYDGPPRAAVSGTVNLDGAPLPYGMIEFVGTGGGRRANTIVTNGSYTIDEENGPNLGEYKVQVMGYAKAPPASGGEGEEGGDADADSEPDLGPQVVAPEFNTKTTLTATIVAGENKCDFEVKSAQ